MSYAFARAASIVGAVAVTPSTRPPLVTKTPSSLRFVPAWKTMTSASTSSSPEMGLPFETFVAQAGTIW